MSRTEENAAYDVEIVPRHFGMCSDDWHATITRRSDGKQLIFINDWLWVLKLRVRRPALDRAFRRLDRHEAKMAEVQRLTR